MFLRSSLYVFALCCSVAIAPAHADIYIRHETDSSEADEIHLSNIPGQDGFELLVSESPSGESKREGSVGAPARNTSPTKPIPYDQAVRVAARETGIDPILIHAVIATESGYNPRAVSPKGARGLMQLMPGTARDLHVSNPDSPEENILGGARYLRALLDEFGKLELALAAYNSGPANVRKAGNRIPNVAETRQYVPRVLHLYHRLGNI